MLLISSAQGNFIGVVEILFLKPGEGPASTFKMDSAKLHSKKRKRKHGRSKAEKGDAAIATNGAVPAVETEVKSKHPRTEKAHKKAKKDQESEDEDEELTGELPEAD